jgi:SAM-dependent methyltransferase
MAISKIIGLQFRKPVGVLGKIIANLMIVGNHNFYKTMIDYLTIRSDDKILEIGYGPGIGVDMISKRFETCDIYGIDFSDLMYRRASKRNKQVIQNNRVHLLLGDFLDTEINMGLFDKIFCINVVYFWDDLHKPFSRVISLLRDDGIFCLYMEKNDDLNKVKLTKNDIFNKYSIEQISKALKAVGFKEVDFFFKKGYFIKAKK